MCLLVWMMTLTVVGTLVMCVDVCGRPEARWLLPGDLDRDVLQVDLLPRHILHNKLSIQYQIPTIQQIRSSLLRDSTGEFTKSVLELFVTLYTQYRSIPLHKNS